MFWSLSKSTAYSTLMPLILPKLFLTCFVGFGSCYDQPHHKPLDDSGSATSLRLRFSLLCLMPMAVLNANGRRQGFHDALRYSSSRRFVCEI